MCVAGGGGDVMIAGLAVAVAVAVTVYQSALSIMVWMIVSVLLGCRSRYLCTKVQYVHITPTYLFLWLI